MEDLGTNPWLEIESVGQVYGRNYDIAFAINLYAGTSLLLNKEYVNLCVEAASIVKPEIIIEIGSFHPFHSREISRRTCIQKEVICTDIPSRNWDKWGKHKIGGVAIEVGGLREVLSQFLCKKTLVCASSCLLKVSPEDIEFAFKMISETNSCIVISERGLSPYTNWESKSKSSKDKCYISNDRTYHERFKANKWGHNWHKYASQYSLKAICGNIAFRAKNDAESCNYNCAFH